MKWIQLSVKGKSWTGFVYEMNQYNPILAAALKRVKKIYIKRQKPLKVVLILKGLSHFFGDLTRHTVSIEKDFMAYFEYPYVSLSIWAEIEGEG